MSKVSRLMAFINTRKSMSFARTARRWVRSKPQRTYEWQLSSRYWNLKHRWEQAKFAIGKGSFGVKSWSSSQSQYFLTLLEILKTISRDVVLALLIIAILAVVGYLLAPYVAAVRFLPRLDPNATADFLGIVAQVAGVFLGLYFTAVSVVASTVYAKVPGEIRELLTKEKVGNLYILVVAFTVAVPSLLLAKSALGFAVGILDVALVAVLAVVSIFSFVVLGMRIFYFFDFTKLARQLDAELARWLKAATAKGFRFRDPSFQAHYQKRAEDALRTYGGVVSLALEDQHFDGRALSDLILAPLMLLQVYAKNKNSIPSESQWFRRIYRHRNWLTANYDQVGMALRSGTSLQPEAIPDLLWFEKHIEKHCCPN